MRRVDEPGGEEVAHDGRTTADAHVEVAGCFLREVSGEEKAIWWERAVATWPEYAKYQTKTERQIPVFVLEPASPD